MSAAKAKAAAAKAKAQAQHQAKPDPPADPKHNEPNDGQNNNTPKESDPDAGKGEAQEKHGKKKAPAKGSRVRKGKGKPAELSEGDAGKTQGSGSSGIAAVEKEEPPAKKPRRTSRPVQKEDSAGSGARKRKATSAPKEPQPKVCPVKPAKAAAEVDSGDGAKSFARRNMPVSPFPRAKWLAIQQSFNELIKPHLTHYSKMEA